MLIHNYPSFQQVRIMGREIYVLRLSKGQYSQLGCGVYQGMSPKHNKPSNFALERAKRVVKLLT